MYEDPKAKIETIIQGGYKFRFGDYISKGFNLLQRNLGGFILFTLLFFVLSFVIQFIPFIGAIANNLIVTPALIAGIYLVAHKLNHGVSAQFGDFFKGFDYIGQLALTMLVYAGIMLISLIPFILVVKDTELVSWYWEVMQDPTMIEGTLPPSLPAWTYLLLLPAIYLGVAYSWSVLFVVFYKMTFWDALESSRRLITKNWFIFFLFTIVITLIAVAGAILLCIGLLATFPAMYCMQYAAFEDVTQLNVEPGGEMDIEEHLVD